MYLLHTEIAVISLGSGKRRLFEEGLYKKLSILKNE